MFVHVCKLHCVSFLNITKSMSNYSAIYSTIEEIGGLCRSLGGAVNAVVSTNDHLVDHKVLLYGFIPNRKFQYFSMLLSLLLCSIYQNTSKSGERNQYSKCNLIIYDTEVKALATPTTEQKEQCIKLNSRNMAH